VEISVLRNVLDANDVIAKENRKAFDAHGCFVVNLMSAPGSGKTTLLERTLRALDGRLKAGVIEGDVQGSLDADRLARLGVPVAQINTDPHFGGECHLDARMVWHALPAIELDGLDLVFIENVGNLVCPASWDLGEDAKVVLFSVTEGEDKPLKYPKMFQQARCAVLSKMDLLPHVPFKVEQAVEFARRVNPELEIVFTSSVLDDGLEEWYGFLRSQLRRRSAA